MAGPKKDKGAGNAAPVSDPSLTLAQQRVANKKAVLQGVLKKYGKGSIGKAEELASRGVPRISSGVFVLDYALGGGWPRGRMSIIWGGPSCSKTTLMLKMIADAQKRDALTNKYLWEVEDQSEAVPMQVAFIDIEGTFDQNWAEIQGVDVSNLEYVRPENSEQAADIVEALIRSASMDVIIIDSIAMMTPQAEVQGQMTDQNVGVAARLNTKLFRKVTAAMNSAALSERRLVPTLFVINQVRNKIGVMFGSPDTKPGGVSQDFVASTEVKVSGNQVKYFDPDDKKFPKWAEFGFKVAKNKVSMPKIEGDYCMALADDPDGSFKVGETIEKKAIIEFSEKLGVLTNEGKSWKYLDQEFKTKSAAVEYWMDDPQRFLVLKRTLLLKLCPKQ